MSEERLKYLFERHLAKICTPAEKEELSALALEARYENVVKEILEESWEKTGIEEDMPEEKAKFILDAILKGEHQEASFQTGKLRWMSWRRIAVAASIIMVIGLSGYFLFFDKSGKQQEIVQTPEQRFKNDVKPGGYKARLTLADGSTIILDSAALGELTKQGSTAIINKNGQLVYDAQGKTQEDVLYNTLSTNRGEMYITVLADGSKIWLNSASSIKYPVSFIGKERRVEITGEAYFEVAHDNKKPFHVFVNGMDVQVIGTHFNINAYSDETSIKTTLLEGSVKVLKGEKNIIIKPGEQADLKANGELSRVNNADLEEVMAWKNGLFSFKGSDINTIMKQVARWYDVEVVFEKELNEKFYVEVSRNTNVSSLFKMLEATKAVHFKIEGKKIIVTPGAK